MLYENCANIYPLYIIFDLHAPHILFIENVFEHMHREMIKK